VGGIAVLVRAIKPTEAAPADPSWEVLALVWPNKQKQGS
jgi:hypothetical protein